MANKYSDYTKNISDCWMHPGRSSLKPCRTTKKKQSYLLFSYGKWKDQLQTKHWGKKPAECKLSPGFVIADLRPRLAGDRSSSEAISFLFPDSETGGARGLSCPFRVGVVLLLEVLGEPRLPRRFLFPSTRLSAIQYAGINYGLVTIVAKLHKLSLYLSVQKWLNSTKPRRYISFLSDRGKQEKKKEKKNFSSQALYPVCLFSSQHWDFVSKQLSTKCM